MVNANSPKTQLVWDKKLLDYNFGKNHPLNPLRLQLCVRLLEDLGLLSANNVQIVPTVQASSKQLRQMHSLDYISAVENPNLLDKPSLQRFGLDTADMPLFSGMHVASANLVGGSVQSAQAIVGGKCLRAINLGGGMHHAQFNKANGFCVYNDVVAAILVLLQSGMQKILYVDLDAHHGDGVETFFWDNPQVLTISLHQTGESLFPGTGNVEDIGAKTALGSAVNIPLPAGSDDSDWLRAFYSVVVPLTEAFEPNIIVSQHGCDGHISDPLADLNLTVEGQREAMLALRDLVEKYCSGKWLALGGGGYNITYVVPRVWAHLFGVVADLDIALDSEIPKIWQQYVKEITAGVGAIPNLMGDGTQLWWRNWESGYEQESEVDRIILAVRKKVFPLHGLDPWFS